MQKKFHVRYNEYYLQVPLAVFQEFTKIYHETDAMLCLFVIQYQVCTGIYRLCVLNIPENVHENIRGRTTIEEIHYGCFSENVHKFFRVAII